MRIALIALFLLDAAGCSAPRHPDGSPSDSGTYDQVIRSGEIRAGYVVYPPGSYKDPNSGDLSGIHVDALEAAADNLGLKVIWTEEVGWGTMIEGLKAGRYDVVGSAVWANSSRARTVDFTIPLFYSGIGVYTRADDNRFGAQGEGIDDPTVRIATIDGEMADIIAREQFPLAQRVSLPQLSDVSQMLLNVTQNKADVTFVEPAVAFEFLRSNPGTLQNVAESSPIRVFGNAMVVDRGEEEFLSMLNISLSELVQSGEADRLIDRYEPFPGAVYRVAQPYRAVPAPGATP